MPLDSSIVPQLNLLAHAEWYYGITSTTTTTTTTTIPLQRSYYYLFLLPFIHRDSMKAGRNRAVKGSDKDRRRDAESPRETFTES